MISIKVVLTLLAALSCFNLSEGQIYGEAQRVATELDRQEHFMSQVIVENHEKWYPEDPYFNDPFKD